MLFFFVFTCSSCYTICKYITLCCTLCTHTHIYLCTEIFYGCHKTSSCVIENSSALIHSKPNRCNGSSGEATNSFWFTTSTKNPNYILVSLSNFSAFLLNSSSSYFTSMLVLYDVFSWVDETKSFYFFVVLPFCILLSIFLRCLLNDLIVNHSIFVAMQNKVYWRIRIGIQ